jgi:hypothetical protein
MGRKAAAGISYYRMDCAHIRNKKVRLLIGDFGPKGYWVWQCLLAVTYEGEGYGGKGYYFDLNDIESLELFAIDVCKLQVALVKEIILGCIRRSLFDKGVVDMFNVLTSEEIQEVYLDATAERRRNKPGRDGTVVEMIKEYLLIPIDNPKRWENIRFVSIKNEVPRTNEIVPRTNQNVPQANPQSKVKKSKEEKDTGKSPSAPAVPAVNHDTIDLNPASLIAEYDRITVKDNKAVFEFIRDKKPTFIQPFVDLWNLFAEKYGMAKVQKISDSRKRKFSVRIREQQFNLPEILKKAKDSEFLLTGTWFTFDWILENDKNYLKVLEGNYDKKQQQQPALSEQTADAYAEERARLEARTRELFKQ